MTAPTALLIWGGPVMASDIHAVRWLSPVTVLTISHGPGGGFGSSSFSQLAAGWKDAHGRILPQLLAANHLRASDYDRIAIAGFSAFHGLASPLLLADGDAIDAAVSLDACFSGYGGFLGKAGYVAYGERAIAGERLLVLTASSGGGKSVGYTTGLECGDATFEAACQKAGVSGELYAPPPPVPVPRSGLSRRAGDFFYLPYGADYSHGDHVHRLAVPVLDVFLAPYLARPLGPRTAPTAAPRAAAVLGVLGLAMLGLGLGVAYKERVWPFS